jgi:hypothetical protein
LPTSRSSIFKATSGGGRFTRTLFQNGTKNLHGGFPKTHPRERFLKRIHKYSPLSVNKFFNSFEKIVLFSDNGLTSPGALYFMFLFESTAREYRK